MTDAAAPLEGQGSASASPDGSLDPARASARGKLSGTTCRARWLLSCLSCRTGSIPVSDLYLFFVGWDRPCLKGGFVNIN